MTEIISEINCQLEGDSLRLDIDIFYLQFLLFHDLNVCHSLKGTFSNIEYRVHSQLPKTGRSSQLEIVRI